MLNLKSIRTSSNITIFSLLQTCVTSIIRSINWWGLNGIENCLMEIWICSKIFLAFWMATNSVREWMKLKNFFFVVFVWISCTGNFSVIWRTMEKITTFYQQYECLCDWNAYGLVISNFLKIFRFILHLCLGDVQKLCKTTSTKNTRSLIAFVLLGILNIQNLGTGFLLTTSRS